jgi:hypothetical protein
MRINLFAAIALTLMAGCSSSNVQTAFVPDVYFDYSGEWTLKWVDSESHHPVSLAQKENVLSGIYTNAEDVSCSISGAHTRQLEISLDIDCPDWDISMHGISTQKGTVITGRYEAAGNDGKFLLFKNKPMPVAEAKEKKGA